MFPIGCFPGPPDEANTLENWQSIKDANFTRMCPVYRYDDAANLTMLEHCEQLGLKAVVNVKIPMPDAETPLPNDWQQQVQQYVERYSRHKALFGYMLKDEPNAAQFGQMHWLAYSSLAYGVKGIFYFTYWPITPLTLQDQRVTVSLRPGSGTLLRLEGQKVLGRR